MVAKTLAYIIFWKVAHYLWLHVWTALCMYIKYVYLKTYGSQNMDYRHFFPRQETGTGGGLPIPSWLWSLKQEAWKPFKNPVQVGVDQYCASVLQFFVMPLTLLRHTELTVYCLLHWKYKQHKHLSKGSHNQLGTDHNRSIRKKPPFYIFFTYRMLRNL